MARAPQMDNRVFERPILNFPDECPAKHWELDADGQPTNQALEQQRRAEFNTPIPKPRASWQRGETD